jgi:hypothetical protein
MNPENVARLKGIGPTNIKRWSKRFESSPINFGKDLRVAKSGRKVKYPKLDEHVNSYFSRLRAAKVSVSGVMLLKEALSYITLNNLQDIKLSNGWFYKLLKRLKIVKRKATKIAQKSSILFEPEIKKFVSLIIEHR